MARRAYVFHPGHLTRKQRQDLKRATARAVRDDQPSPSTRKDRSLPEPAVSGPFGPGLVEGGYWNLAGAWIPAHQAR